MKGSIPKKQRYPGSWSLIFDLPPVTDPLTGVVKRRQKWVTFKGTRKAAQTRLRELLGTVDRDQFIEPSKLTLAAWLARWLGDLRPRVGKGLRVGTVDLYERTITKHLAPSPLGQLRLQRVRAMDIERYCLALPFATKTIALHRTLLQGALKAAKKNRLIDQNPMAEADVIKGDSARPSRQRAPGSWTADEAQRFLTSAKAAGPQPAALYSLLLDSGCRKGEALGLRWSDLDLVAGTVTIARTLLSSGKAPAFGPTKTGKARTIDLDGETVRLLRAHKSAQAEVKMRTRRWYLELGLVFAREDDRAGEPLGLKGIGQGEFARLTTLAEVRPIRFHDLRHTCATLLLLAGEPVHVVSQRLGHAKVTQTLNTYAHVLKQQQAQAGRTIGALIHGGK